jgi:hypothetical protein
MLKVRPRVSDASKESALSQAQVLARRLNHHSREDQSKTSGGIGTTTDIHIIFQITQYYYVFFIRRKIYHCCAPAV